jgi:hypothetical protein
MIRLKSGSFKFSLPIVTPKEWELFETRLDTLLKYAVSLQIAIDLLVRDQRMRTAQLFLDLEEIRNRLN